MFEFLPSRFRLGGCMRSTKNSSITSGYEVAMRPVSIYPEIAPINERIDVNREKSQSTGKDNPEIIDGQILRFSFLLLFPDER